MVILLSKPIFEDCELKGVLFFMQDITLKKSVTALEAAAIVIGMVIGSSIFLKPSIVLKSAGTASMSILAWVAGGIITLASALTVAELAAAIPKEGGLYTYLSDLYGNVWGFLLGWVQTIISYPASVAAQAIAFSTYACFFIPNLSNNIMEQKLLGIGVLLFILIMNIIATKCGGVIQTLATFGKLIPIAAIIAVGLISNAAPGFSGIHATTASNVSFGAAILGTLWAYDGWISVTNMAGELKNPAKTLPKVISIGLIFVIAVYVLFNLVIFKVLPHDAILATATPGGDAAEALFGKIGGTFLTIGILVSVFGALNGYFFSAPKAWGTLAAVIK